MPEKRVMLIISCLVILLVTIPFIYAFQMGSEEHIFGGFLINLTDGHSYLAKMQLGYQGEWKFVLPYTADPGEGAYLFLLYIGLGHLSRIINFPLLAIFHIARLISAIFLLWVLSVYFKYIFSEPKMQTLGFSIAALGSGVGWLAVVFGNITSDFWVAEAYPFLSMYTNPHFSIGLGLMILALIPGFGGKTIGNLLLGFALGFVQPFAVVIVILVLSIEVIIEIFESRGITLKQIKGSKKIKKLLLFGVGGSFVLLYQYWSIFTDPVLSIWNQQNITESPGILDLIISLSPCLILALLGTLKGWKSEQGRLIVVWVAVSLILIFIPWNLQRRFLSGSYVPLAGLSVFGIEVIINKISIKFRTMATFLFCLILPTNAIVLLSGIQAAAGQDPKIFISSTITDGFDWLTGNSKKDAIVLANEKNGLFIPSMTGRKVVYGHPFETVNAKREKVFMEKFFQGKLQTEIVKAQLTQKGVDFIFYEIELTHDLADWKKEMGYPLVFSNNKVEIYMVTEP
jgi:hypothetical protein